MSGFARMGTQSLISPFGALIRYVLKQPGKQIIPPNMNSKASVMWWKCSTQRTENLSKEGQKRRAHDRPASSSRRSLPFFRNLSFAAKTHDLFVTHHTTDHPQKGIRNQLVLIWTNTSFPPNWVETFFFKSTIYYTELVGRPWLGWNICKIVILSSNITFCKNAINTIWLSCLPQLPGFTLRTMDTRRCFKHSTVASS